jgi:hypothetical protein
VSKTGHIATNYGKIETRTSNKDFTMNFNSDKLVRAAALVIGFLVIVHPVDAKVYKWVDENGKVHYSDQPVDGKGQPIKMKREPTPLEIAEAKKRASAIIEHKNRVQDMADEDRKLKIVATRREEKAENKLIENCEKARREIIKLGRGYRVYEEDSDGKRIFKSDQEKNTEISRLEKAIKENCL